MASGLLAIDLRSSQAGMGDDRFWWTALIGGRGFMARRCGVEEEEENGTYD
jgi:hypothetical protein